MRDILKTEELEIPAGVEVSVKSRLVTVTGPRGTLTKNLRHADVDIRHDFHLHSIITSVTFC